MKLSACHSVPSSEVGLLIWQALIVFFGGPTLGDLSVMSHGAFSSLSKGRFGRILERFLWRYRSDEPVSSLHSTSTGTGRQHCIFTSHTQPAHALSA